MIFDTLKIEPVLNSLQDPLFFLNADRQIIFMNTMAVRMFGAEYLDRNFVRLIRHPDVIQLIDDIAVGDVAGGLKEGSIKVSLEQPLGGVFNFNVINIGDYKEEGTVLSITMRDMSDLAHAEQMRSDFVANVSHELRSPLTALSGFVETMKDRAKDDAPARERFLELMEREAARMVRLIADLLSLSKVEASQHHVPSDKVNMGTLVKRAVTTLSGRAKAEDKTIEIDIGEDMEPVNGSEDELMQVAINLIENAIKYGCPKSTVTVGVKTVENVAGISGKAIAFSVRDRGEGIAKEHLARLTERFYRVDTHRSRDKGGTGLGLAIVKHIVNHHRGRLHVASEVGEGSVFTVHLPLKP